MPYVAEFLTARSTAQLARAMDLRAQINSEIYEPEFSIIFCNSAERRPNKIVGGLVVKNNAKFGAVAGIAAVGAFLAHFGDDIVRGGRRMIGHGDDIRHLEPPRPSGQIVHNLPPVSPSLDSSSLIIGGEQAGSIRVAFGNVVSDSVARLSRDQHLNIQFELASGKLKIGSSRRIAPGVTMGYREINVYNTAMLAGTPLALCWAAIERSTELSLRHCVDRALTTMSGQPDATRDF